MRHKPKYKKSENNNNNNNRYSFYRDFLKLHSIKLKGIDGI